MYFKNYYCKGGGGVQFSQKIISRKGESLNTPHFFASPLGTK